MRKFFRFLRRAGAAANAVRQIILTVALVCSVSQSLVADNHSSNPASIIKI